MGYMHVNACPSHACRHGTHSTHALAFASYFFRPLHAVALVFTYLYFNGLSIRQWFQSVPCIHRRNGVCIELLPAIDPPFLCSNICMQINVFLLHLTWHVVACLFPAMAAWLSWLPCMVVCRHRNGACIGQPWQWNCHGCKQALTIHSRPNFFKALHENLCVFTSFAMPCCCLLVSIHDNLTVMAAVHGCLPAPQRCIHGSHDSFIVMAERKQQPHDGMSHSIMWHGFECKVSKTIG